MPASNSPPPSGRLELTWTNKHLRLIDHLDGTYEWVDPSDWRVAEVRLLRDRDTVGEVASDRDRSSDNLLIQGDALSALRALGELPEFASHYAGAVKLAYLDPPFNTGETFEQYDDALEHSVWLTMLRDRLSQIRRLLHREGSVWLHLDDSEVHRARCVLDEVFGPNAFIAHVVWQKRYSRENRAAIGQVHDHILVYAPMGSEWRDVRNRLPRKEDANYRNPNNDPKGPWRVIPMTAQGHRPNQMYEITSPTGVTHTPPKGRCWSMIRETFEELLEQGRIYWGKEGDAQPGVIRYLSEAPGLVPWTWWPSDEVGHTDESKKEMLKLFPDTEAFATPKPERLIHRIITIGSDPGDVVLDCFAGSATTAAVAHKMGRRWVAIEREVDTVATYAEPRLRKVVDGDDEGGITKMVAWDGGGGFRILDVGRSMFEPDGDGRVWLAGWATDGRLSEATAAQLGFPYQPHGPFVGTKGRVRLAVIDGLVNGPVLEALSEALDDGESMLVAGTAVAPEATETARKLAKGSRVRKIPSSILASWRRTERVG